MNSNGNMSPKMKMSMWSINSWKLYHHKYIPEYTNETQLQSILDDISRLPGLITQNSFSTFQQAAYQASSGNMFIIQVGDCSEPFSECDESHWIEKFTFLQALAARFHSKTKIVPLIIGRICGQFSKPRSNEYENDSHILTYRGDLINSTDINQREPDPMRLLKGIVFQQAGLEVLRRYNKKRSQNGQKNGKSNSPNYYPIYTSHECLHLPYESSLVRKYEQNNYTTSAHFLWIGERTKDAQGAHVHFLSGIKNSIGVKIGSTITEEDFLNLNTILNPSKIQGKLFFIFRFGMNKIRTHLPLIVEWKIKYQLEFGFICDPMHGNTYECNGFKTRCMEDIFEEIFSFVEILSEMKQTISGIHFEGTPYDVTECVDTKQDSDDKNKITKSKLNSNYQTSCDPRSNFEQSLKIIDYLANSLITYQEK